MKKDIILSGVGGQGILSIATVIGKAALKMKEEQQKSVQAWTLFLLRKESGSKGALLRSVPSGILSLL